MPLLAAVGHGFVDVVRVSVVVLGVTPEIEAFINGVETDGMAIDERLFTVMVALIGRYEITDIWRLPADLPE